MAACLPDIILAGISFVLLNRLYWKVQEDWFPKPATYKAKYSWRIGFGFSVFSIWSNYPSHHLTKLAWYWILASLCACVIVALLIYSDYWFPEIIICSWICFLPIPDFAGRRCMISNAAQARFGLACCFLGVKWICGSIFIFLVIYIIIVFKFFHLFYFECFVFAALFLPYKMNTVLVINN